MSLRHPVDTALCVLCRLFLKACRAILNESWHILNESWHILNGSWHILNESWHILNGHGTCLCFRLFVKVQRAAAVCLFSLSESLFSLSESTKKLWGFSSLV